MTPRSILWAAVAAVLAAACRKEEPAPPKNLPPLPTEKALRGAAEPAAPPVVPPAALDGKRVESATGLSFAIPDGWKRQAPQSSLRLAELVPPRAEGETADGLLVVSFFAGGAGSFEANVTRWASQVTDERGAPRAPSSGRVREFATPGHPRFRIFEIDGDHTETNMRTGESKKTPGARLVVATLDTDSGSYFFKLVAPVKTAEACAPAFEALLASVELR